MAELWSKNLHFNYKKITMTSLFHDESTFGLSSELTGAIAKRLSHAINQHYVPGSFFNQFVTDV